jgi:uncharacterized protein YqhQ
MDPNLESRLAALEEKVDKVFISSEKTRKYFLWTMWTSVALFVLPAIGLVFVIPMFLTNYVQPIQQLTQ